MIKKKRTERTVLLVGVLGAAFIMQVAFVPTPGLGADRHADQPRGIAGLRDGPDDEGPTPCTVSSPCESRPLSAFAAAEDTPYTRDSSPH
jgi:hypothetical protein